MDASKPGVDLEKELTCSVSSVPVDKYSFRACLSPLVRCTHLVSSSLADLSCLLSRYVQSCYIIHSPFSIVYIPSVAPASKNGSTGKQTPQETPRLRLLRTLPSLHAHHVGPQFATRGTTRPLPHYWTWSWLRIQRRRSRRARRKRWIPNTNRVTRSCQSSTSRGRRPSSYAWRSMNGDLLTRFGT